MAADRIKQEILPRRATYTLIDSVDEYGSREDAEKQQIRRPTDNELLFSSQNDYSRTEEAICTKIPNNKKSKQDILPRRATYTLIDSVDKYGSREDTEKQQIRRPTDNELLFSSQNDYSRTEEAICTKIPNNKNIQQFKQKGTKKMREKEDTLTVAVRIRPINEQEVLMGNTEIISVVEDNVVCLMDPTENDDMNVLRVNRSREKMFVFDTAFGPFSTQMEVYNQTTKALVESVLEGYNATIFAYGPTGAGKTFTMLGTDVEPGIMALTLNDLYKSMERTKGEQMYTVRMSYLEIYNEMIRDLLNPSTEFLDLREDHRGVQVAGLTEYEAHDTSHVMQMLSRGNKERMCEPTAVNKTSSRSHAVLQVTVEKKSRIRGITDEVKTAKLFLIDLAGSERAAQTQNTGKRLIEGAHINRSLLALGNCINALTEKGSKYVNYRDSKLTRLLKDSLGGNCKTVMIAHVSPASNSFEESRNTLTYADRAKNIKLKAKRNQYSVNYHVAQYQGIITDLRQEIIRLKTQLVEVDSMEQKSPRASSGIVEKLKKDLKSRFEEQLSLRKELIDLEDSSLQLAVEYQRHMLAIDEWEQEQSRNRVRESKGKKRAVRHMFRPKRSNKLYDPYDIEEKDLDTEKSPALTRKVQEPADVIVAREEITNISQQQEEIEYRKKHVLEKLEKEKRENHNLEQRVLSQASNEYHREILKTLCYVHEYQIRNIELESIALMKEYLVQQKDLEMQRGNMRRGLVDEIMTMQKALIKDNHIRYPRDLEALHELYKEQIEKDETILSSVHIENRRYGTKVPTLPSITQQLSDYDTAEESRANSIINTPQPIRLEKLIDRRRRDLFNDRESVSSRHTLFRDHVSQTNDPEIFSDAGSFRNVARKSTLKKLPILNNPQQVKITQEKQLPRRRDTFKVPAKYDDRRSRGETFRVLDDKEFKQNYNTENDRHSIASLQYAGSTNTGMMSQKDEYKRKRSASAKQLREVMKEKSNQQSSKAYNMQQPPHDQALKDKEKPGWNNNFRKTKLEHSQRSQPVKKLTMNLPTLKKAKISPRGNSTLLVGHKTMGNETLAISGTSFVPKHNQPGFGRI